MPVESIGEAGTAGASRGWINAECEIAIKHLKRVCGEPPPAMELEVQWQEHDFGTYPLIVLAWEDAMRGTPWNYLESCRVALTAYENGGELPLGWSMPPVCSEDDSDSVPFDPGKAPPDPPETLNLFENQRYLSKLIQWGLEASERRRSRPYLVERDDDEPSES